MVDIHGNTYTDMVSSLSNFADSVKVDSEENQWVFYLKKQVNSKILEKYT